VSPASPASVHKAYHTLCEQEVATFPQTAADFRQQNSVKEYTYRTFTVNSHVACAKK